MSSLLELFLNICLVSITSYSGSAQSVFYEIGVHQLNWITNQDYISYLGFGFASPGPQVYSLATFMGFGHSKFVGALIGTIAIYLIPISLAILTGKYLQKWIQKKYALYFIKSVSLVAAGLLLSIGVKILTANQISLAYLLIAAISAIAVYKKVSPVIIIITGLLLGLGL